jgi:outer membrane protein assembly factor BamB
MFSVGPADQGLSTLRGNLSSENAERGCRSRGSVARSKPAGLPSSVAVSRVLRPGQPRSVASGRKNPVPPDSPLDGVEKSRVPPSARSPVPHAGRPSAPPAKAGTPCSRRRAVLRLIPIALLSSLALDSATADWPRFRGPNGSGLGQANIPAQWTDANRQWSVKLPGVGHGSPVVWGSRVFVLCGDQATARRIAVCVDANTGKTLWQQSFDSLLYRHHKFNSVASSTPAVDAERVYFAWGTPQQTTLIAFTHDGNKVWETDLGPVKREHGFASSPIVHGDLVILSNDQESDSHLFALDARSGKVRWKLPRAENHSNYSTPCIFTPPGGKPQVIVVSWRLGVTGVDLAAGKQLWQMPLFATRAERAIGSPSTLGEYVIVNCAFVGGPKHVVVLKPGKPTGTMEEVWRLEKTVPHIPSPILVGDRAVLWNDQGIVTGAELETGKILFEERVPGEFFGSPVCAGDKLFAVDKKGTAVAIAASDKFQLLGTNPLNDPCQSTPAIAGGRMFIRTWSQLHAIGPGRQ